MEKSRVSLDLKDIVLIFNFHFKGVQFVLKGVQLI